MRTSAEGEIRTAISIIRASYLQRTRSYSFLITLAISLMIAYAFVPAPGAGYSTMRVGDFVGNYNSAWVACLTAIMASVFLSLAGFFLVNDTIKRDTDTRVGMIVAATAISNFRYLLYKALSSLAILLTILALVFLMSFVLFLWYGNGPFNLVEFITPYVLIPFPAMVLCSSLALIGEIFLGRNTVIQYILYFSLFIVSMSIFQNATETRMVQWLDPFGLKIVTTGLEKTVLSNYNESAKTSVGFIYDKSKSKLRTFTFDGVDWSTGFVLSRIGWMIFGVALIFISSMPFHRFDSRDEPKSIKGEMFQSVASKLPVREVKLSQLPAIRADKSIAPLIKIEFLMLIRKSSKWLQVITIGGVIALFISPLYIAHPIVLPILWFLHVTHWSEIAIKENMYRSHAFLFASYKPLRILFAQFVAGLTLAIILASPLLLRYLLSGSILSCAWIISGSFFVITFSIFLGVVSHGKKLFEILFFILTYCNLNYVPLMDYFGGINKGLNGLWILWLIVACLLALGIIKRQFEIRNVYSF